MALGGVHGIIIAAPLPLWLPRLSYVHFKQPSTIAVAPQNKFPITENVATSLSLASMNTPGIIVVHVYPESRIGLALS